MNTNLDFKYDFTGIEGIDDNNNIFPPNFCCLIIGKPGCGKTTLLRQILLNPNLLYKKYEYVFIMSPSIEEFPFVMNPQSCTNKFNLDWLYNNIFSINEQDHVNILIIIDDFISFIKKEQHNPRLLSLFYNRRHLAKNGTISIILTSQYYMAVPLAIRSNSNLLFLFTIAYKDIVKIWVEHIWIPKKSFISLMSFPDKCYFLICNLQDNKFFLKFDPIDVSQ